MWQIIAAAAMLGLGFIAILVLGITAVHIGMRWHAMLAGGLDWDDAGALIRARYRRKHGLHRSDGVTWQDTGALDGNDPGPAYKNGHSRLGERITRAARQPLTSNQAAALAAIASDAQLPLQLPQITRATGRPPWDDETHTIPVVPGTEYEVHYAETQAFTRPDDMFRRDDPGYGR